VLSIGVVCETSSSLNITGTLQRWVAKAEKLNPNTLSRLGFMMVSSLK
jgi:hypothetical protein